MADRSILTALSSRELLEQLNLHVNEPEPTIIHTWAYGLDNHVVMWLWISITTVIYMV